MELQRAQKKLFFNLRKIKSKINALEDGDLSPNQVNHIAKTLDVAEEEVVNMNRRMLGGDYSLNSRISRHDGEEGEWQDLLADGRDSQEVKFVATRRKKHTKENDDRSLRFIKT